MTTDPYRAQNITVEQGLETVRNRQPPPIPQHDWTGCSRRCRDGHTRVWGQCEVAAEPPPPAPVVPETFIASDGHPATRFVPALPRRGDAVETWIKRTRDQFPETAVDWQALDDLLDDYRLHADCGVPLSEPTPHSTTAGVTDD
jgi:hypothetical protein